ncbi:MAG TPA: histidine phosphatase family protein, partial [Acidaminococcaceae bacterium]|nr:histidine phosphatase family protein [Acidaminococcaceae bacterium]
GLKESEAKALYLPPATLKELDHRNYPGGETRREFFRRSVDGLHQNADWEKENLIIISHKGTIQNIIFAWLGMDIEDVNRLNYSVDILPSSVTVLGINKWKEHAIFRLNDLSHLQAGEGYGLHKFKLGAIDALFQK